MKEVTCSNCLEVVWECHTYACDSIYCHNLICDECAYDRSQWQETGLCPTCEKQHPRD